MSSENGKKRYRIDVSEYAELPGQREAWDGLGNPVHYTSLNELGIDAREPTFQRVSSRGHTPTGVDVGSLLAEAKEQLARALQINPASTEIVVRA